MIIQQSPGSKRGRATSAAGTNALGRPRRSVLPLGVMKLAAFLCIAGLVCVGCASRKITTVPQPYAAVTNQIAQWRPAKASWRGFPSDVRNEEKVPGQLFVRSLFERGDPKFGPYTVVQVSRADDAHATVELRTTKRVLFGLFGKRHQIFIERQRWKEVQEILRK